MTNRQHKIWYRKMISLEKGLLDYYRRNPDKEPDGSFCMSAFKDGYYLDKRERREKRKAE